MPRGRSHANVSYPKLVGPSDTNLTQLLASFDDSLADYFKAFEAKQKKNSEELRKYIDREVPVTNIRARKQLETILRRTNDSAGQLRRLQRTLRVRNQIISVKREQEKTLIVEDAVRARKTNVNWAQPGIIATPMEEKVAKTQEKKIDDRSADILALEEAFGGGLESWA